MSSFSRYSDDGDLALPNETLTAIFQEFSPADLAVVSRVSMRFNAVAERLLYSAIFVRDILTESSPAPWRTLRCCEAMLKRSQLVKWTHSFCVRWQVDADSPPTHFLLIQATSILSQALSTLVYLSHLDIYLGPANIILSNHTENASLHVIERIIYGCQFPYLKSCSIGADWLKGAQAYTGVLDNFLASLPSLLHLKLHDHHSSISLPKQALSHLVSFRGSSETAAALLPGRPVQRLALIGTDSDVNREYLASMTHTSTPIQSLDLSSMSIRLAILRTISHFLPHLEMLRIRLTLRHTLHYAMSGLRILAGLSSVLSDFHDLSCLDLSPTPITGVMLSNPGTTTDEESVLCTEWSRGCPSLRVIIFPSQQKWVQELGTRAWVLIGIIPTS